MKMVHRALAAGATLLASSTPALAAWSDLNLRVGVTPLSQEIHGLHMLILWISVAIAVAVFGAMIYSIATFRKSKGAVPADFDHSTKAEVLWTVIPVLILVGMAIPAGVRAAVYSKEQWEKTAKNEKIDEKALKPIELKYTLCHPAGSNRGSRKTPITRVLAGRRA